MATLAVSALLGGDAVRLEVKGPYLLATNIYVNGRGPFRFLLDTGAQSSMVSKELAHQLRLEPSARVEHVTSAGTRIALTTLIDSVALGSASARSVEALIGQMAAVHQFDRSLDGVLGQSFLAKFNYLLDNKAARFVPDPPHRYMRGDAVPFQRSDGRMALMVQTVGMDRRLVLDSGTSSMVLFGASQFQAANAVITTNAGDAHAAVSLQRARIGNWLSKPIQTAVLHRSDPGQLTDGLLPTGASDALYVNNDSGYVVINPR